MEREHGEKLVGIVLSAVEDNVLTEEDAQEILAVCRRATDRAIAKATEEYLTARIEGEIQ